MLNQSLTGVSQSLKSVLTLHAVVCLTASLIHSTTAYSNATDTPACSLAIRNINLIPMDNEQVIPAQTVLISNEYIVAVGPSSKLTTKGCKQIIAGKGRYLMPGLNDMHTHLETVAFDKAFGKESVPINFDDVLAPYLAYGITGLRVLSGAPDLLDARNNINKNKLPLPRLVVASPMLTGESFILPEPLTAITADAKSARAAVRQYAADGYDLIKIRGNLSKEAYEAVIDEANKVGIDVDGHLSTKTGSDLFATLQSGQKGFAHIDEIASKAARTSEGDKKAIELLLKCNCYVSTTIAIFQNIYNQLENYDVVASRLEMHHTHPQWKQGFWSRSKNPYLKERPPKEIFPKISATSRAFVKKLYVAGGLVLAGSDALNPMMIPGSSMHEELAELTKAGLTPYEALTTATSYSGRAIYQFADLGQIRANFVANLLLTKDNPLVDLAHTKNADFVIVNGHALSRKELDRNLEQAAEQFGTLKSKYSDE